MAVPDFTPLQKILKLWIENNWHTYIVYFEILNLKFEFIIHSLALGDSMRKMRTYVSHVDAWRFFFVSRTTLFHYYDSTLAPHFPSVVYTLFWKAINFPSTFPESSFLLGMCLLSAGANNTKSRQWENCEKNVKGEFGKVALFLVSNLKVTSHTHPHIYLLPVWRKKIYNETQVKGLNFEKVFREFRMR